MILVRHGACEPDYSLNPSLTEMGRIMVDQLQLQPQWKISTLITSPKKRALETAEILGCRLKAHELYVINELREIHPSILDSSYSFQHPDQKRAYNIYENIILNLVTREDILIVSHKNLLSYLLSRLRNLKINCNGDKNFDNFCAIIEFSTNQNIVNSKK